VKTLHQKNLHHQNTSFAVPVMKDFEKQSPLVLFSLVLMIEVFVDFVEFRLVLFVPVMGVVCVCAEDGDDVCAGDGDDVCDPPPFLI
jgi:hypothetical protein